MPKFKEGDILQRKPDATPLQRSQFYFIIKITTICGNEYDYNAIDDDDLDLTSYPAAQNLGVRHPVCEIEAAYNLKSNYNRTWRDLND